MKKVAPHGAATHHAGHLTSISYVRSLSDKANIGIQERPGTINLTRR
nr:MAG TPA: hypothetical protein [Caudoviricetes sp.]DAP48296.1 MAG TPA: hypothetical protein [Caudoviricetes sp.]